MRTLKALVSARAGFLTPVAAAAALVAASGATPVQAQEAATSRVVITGSHIRRADSETPSPVLTLSAQDIARSGYSSMADVLGSLSANNMGSLGQATPAAFGAGGSGISLRGLTVGATLVLIDGQRMASYPLPDDGQRDFVDINSIPIDAVERIEVLKDGASAIYGSDAMAGVVNVILKKSHKGTTLHAELGGAQHGGGRSVHVSGIRGFGDLAKDGIAGYLSADFRERRPILLSQRSYLTTSDYSAWGGISDGYPPDNGELQVAPRTRTYSVLGRLTTRLAGDWTADLSASMLGSQAEQVGLLNWVSPSAGITSFRFGASNPNPVPTTLNGTNIIDPATGAPVDATLSDLGAQRSKTDSRSYRLVATAGGTWRDWDVQASLGLTRVSTRLDMHNYVSLPLLQAALNNGSYVVGGSNSAAVIAGLTPRASSTSTNDLQFVNLRATREIGKLPGGDLAIGTGVELMHRELNERFPDAFANGTQSSNIYAFGVGTQNIQAAYVELHAPVSKTLQLDAAARIDRYVGQSSSVTPKFGAKYTPTKTLTLRGTYAGGFRAPNPVEIGTSGSSAGFLPALYDTALCAAIGRSPCDIGVGGTQLQLPGKDLKPEKSRSYTLGLIFEPTPNINLSVDYYDVRISNQIVSVGLFGQAQIDNPTAYGTQLYRVNSPTVANAAPTGADDTILYGTYPFLNVGQTRTDGLDVDLRGRWESGGDKFSAQIQWTHMFHYTIDRDGKRYELAGTHGPSFVSTNTGTPRDRVGLTLTWARGPLEISSTTQYTSSFSVVDPSYDINDCSAALSYIYPNGAPSGSSLCRVGSFTTSNLSLRYTQSPALQWRFSVINLFDRKAPIDAFASSSSGGGVAAGGAHYNPSLHQDGAVGRYFNVGMTYSF
ncbi:TonB-dependent receptor [Ideonella sp. DXS22W]|uniref:TonB-dependent receptor n=1 Tax=Pseudaquabacterium inlustre TaxID=2984192 RepID=A0ABU9CK88_9BURK